MPHCPNRSRALCLVSSRWKVEDSVGEAGGSRSAGGGQRPDPQVLGAKTPRQGYTDLLSTSPAADGEGALPLPKTRSRTDQQLELHCGPQENDLQIAPAIAAP